MLILRNVSSQTTNESGLVCEGPRPVTDDAQAADRDLQAISDLLLQARGGDPDAMNRLFPLVYRELGRLAHWQLQAEPAGHTLDTCALVHETFLKVVDQPRVHWRDRAHGSARLGQGAELVAAGTGRLSDHDQTEDAAAESPERRNHHL
jgi:hypothetical protein